MAAPRALRSAQKFQRVTLPTGEIPASWRPFLGSYGPEFIPLIVSARHGHLYAMTENMADYRLRPVSEHIFSMPAGLYLDEYLVFMVDGEGWPRGACLANMYLPRRP